VSLFNQRKPRRFTHHYLYVDERKEHLRQIEQRGGKETGMPKPDNSTDYHRLQGFFLQSAKHTRRYAQHRQSGALLTQSIVILLFVFVLIVIWNLLLS
jgi:hypothetical protein